MSTRAVAKPKQAASSAAGARAPSGLLQRAWACGETPGVDGSCAECRSERLQRFATEHDAPAQVPSVVHEVLRSPGRPLDAHTRIAMEARFASAAVHAPIASIPAASARGALAISPATDPLERGADDVAARAMRTQAPDGEKRRWDFSRIRIHTDARAAQSARTVNALAYTVGDHIVFGTGRYPPGSAAGERLLAHELAHTMQANGGRIARQPVKRKDPFKEPRWRPHKPTLPPHTPAAPSARRTDVPAGVTPCLTGRICDPPVRGSATDFGQQAEEESTTRPAKPTPAKEVKQVLAASAPGVLGKIFEVTVNPGLAETVGAQVDVCKEFNVKAPDATASCVEVPTYLEAEAARFNQGLECLDENHDEDAVMCVDRDSWLHRLVQLMIHEAAHVTFRRHTPVGISSRTSNKTTLHELSELYAQLSEFPGHYRWIAKVVLRYDKEKARELFETSMKTWVKMHVESEGEGIRGMLTKLRCVNPCEKVSTLVTTLVQSVTASWPEEIKSTLLQRLHDAEKLDWPMPAPIQPPAPERPKFPPLYQPRGTFVPELEKSPESLQ